MPRFEQQSVSEILFLIRAVQGWRKFNRGINESLIGAEGECEGRIANGIGRKHPHLPARPLYRTALTSP